ncbi:MAG: ribonuclease H-like domain-containing protein [Candidatus Sericytochromatia bacterium]
MTTYLFFDIETVVNEDFFYKTASEKQKEKKETENDFFMPSIYHVPVALSCLYAGSDKKPRFVSYSNPNISNLGILESKFFENLNLIMDCNKKYYEKDKKGKNFKDIHPILVSHNGHNFDLPILTLRAMNNHEKLPEGAKEGLKEYLNDSDTWEKSRANYTNKYSKFNIDTYKIFNSNLKAICELFGIEAKTEMDGSKVRDYYAEEKYHEIAKYCAEDVLALSRVFNKYLIAKGENSLNLPSSIEECEIKLL